VGRTVEVTVEDGLATLRIGRAHGNAINGELAGDLIGAVHEAAADARIRGALLAASGKLFSPGLDLQELIELDRPGMQNFLHRFSACMLTLYTFSKPLVAAIQGPAIAGGFLLTLTADWRVMREGAKVGLAEIRVGVPFPFGVAMILRDAVPRTQLTRVALFGKDWTDQEALEAGLVHEVRPADGFEPLCRQRLEELASKDSVAFAISKRYLRSSTVERVRAHDPQFTEDFLDSWFEPGTQERIRKVVEGLRG
jgi:enoyl-CoA hydratase/carnithine racemase